MRFENSALPSLGGLWLCFQTRSRSCHNLSILPRAQSSWNTSYPPLTIIYPHTTYRCAVYTDMQWTTNHACWLRIKELGPSRVGITSTTGIIIAAFDTGLIRLDDPCRCRIDHYLSLLRPRCVIYLPCVFQLSLNLFWWDNKTLSLSFTSGQ